MVIWHPRTLLKYSIVVLWCYWWPLCMHSSLIMSGASWQKWEPSPTPGKRIGKNLKVSRNNLRFPHRWATSWEATCSKCGNPATINKSKNTLKQLYRLNSKTNFSTTIGRNFLTPSHCFRTWWHFQRKVENSSNLSFLSSRRKDMQSKIPSSRLVIKIVNSITFWLARFKSIILIPMLKHDALEKEISVLLSSSAKNKEKTQQLLANFARYLPFPIRNLFSVWEVILLCTRNIANCSSSSNWRVRTL